MYRHKDVIAIARAKSKYNTDAVGYSLVAAWARL
jgi:hypothetical protein